MFVQFIHVNLINKRIEYYDSKNRDPYGTIRNVNFPTGDDSATEAEEEKTEFDLVLEEVPSDKKIAILKVVRGITGLGLKEAKEMVEAAPKTIQEGMAKDAAETAKKQLEEAGGKVALR